MTRYQDRSREDDDLLQLYLNDIGKHPLLTRADESRLGALVQAGQAAATRLAEDSLSIPLTERGELRAIVAAGDEAAKDFARSNLRLVVSVAKRFKACGLPLLDIIQEGNFGLLQAVERFDPKRGFKFSTYATWWIRQTISRGIASSSRAIRLPTYASDQLLAIRLAASALEVRHGRRPTPEEVAEAAELPVRKVEELSPYLSDPRSLSERNADADTELGDMVEDMATPPPDQTVLASMLPAQVLTLLSVLDPREQEVLCLRYGLDRGVPRTLEEVGRHFGLTREGARMIEVKAMHKLRRMSTRGARDLLTA